MQNTLVECTEVEKADVPNTEVEATDVEQDVTDRKTAAQGV
jgi:hypothetical protein